MHYRMLAYPAVIAFFICQSIFIPAHAGPMDLSGQFAVNESGAATYTIPIRVPPGTSGIEPKLALTYNSRGGDGLLGVGWSLSGLSVITRCPRTVAQDGVRGGVNFDLNDRYCLDGQRLIAISGADGGNNTEYRTELESFSKIVSYGSAGNGPASFKVWTKDGLIMEYGNFGSAIEAQGKTSIAVWAVNRVSDVKENYLSIKYIKGQGYYYPDRIDYTGNFNTGLATNSYVQFTYENRPDVVTRYQAGSMIRFPYRLQSITTYQSQYGAGAVKKYSLAYNLSEHTARSRLASIRECDRLGNCLPGAITFSWFTLGTRDFQAPLRKVGFFGKDAGGWSDDNIYPRMLADVNGDGLPDIVGFASNGVYVSLNTGTGFAAQTMWIADFGRDAGSWSDMNAKPRMLVDVNGDGLPDIVGFAYGGVYVSLNTGTSFAPRTLWIADFGRDAGDWPDMTKKPRMLVDVNGDGLPDIVGFAYSGVYVSLNTGTSFAPRTLWIADFGQDVGNWFGMDIKPRMLVDVNGDGLPDIVGFADDGVYVSLNTGTSFAPRTLWIADFGRNAGNWSDMNTKPRRLADVNGDGLPDIVGFADDGVYVSLNTGTGFTSRTRWIADFGKNAGWTDMKAFVRMLADVNGDGLPDIVGFGGAGVLVSLNTGTGFATPTLWRDSFGVAPAAGGWSNNSITPRMLADVNGDGLPDIVGFANDGVYTSIISTQPLVDTVAGIGNGRINLVKLNYKSLVDSTFYTKGSNFGFPIQSLQFPMYAVSSVAVTDTGGDQLTTYKYGGLKADVGRAGRGLLGFGWQESTQVGTGITTRTEYLQDFPCTGLVESTTRKMGAQTLGRSTNIYEISIDFGSTSPRYSVMLSQNVSSGTDLDGSVLPTTTTTYQYDVYNNPTRVVMSTSDGFKKITTNTYQNDTAKWYLGRLLRSQVQSTAP